MSDEQTQQGSDGLAAPAALSVRSGLDASSGDGHQAAANEADADEVTDGDARLIERRIAELQAEHLALDALIAKLITLPGVNDFELRRLKKRKLKVKDSIILLQLQLEPDTRA